MQGQSGRLRLLIDLTKREFRVRYLGSLLGSYWNLIHPIVMILIYTLVFSKMMRSRLGSEAGPFAYSIYLCSGLLAWNLLNEIVNRCTVTLLDNAGFLKKLAFPPYILFGATVASALVNFSIAFSLFLLVLLFLKPISIAALAVYFVVVLLFAIFGIGIGAALGCLNVFMRDFQQLTSVVFQLWFWFTPIVYLADVLPEFAKTLVYFNPAFAFIEPLHQLLYFDRYPEPIFWLLMLGWITLSTLIGVTVYCKTISYVRDHL